MSCNRFGDYVNARSRTRDFGRADAGCEHRNVVAVVPDCFHGHDGAAVAVDSDVYASADVILALVRDDLAFRSRRNEWCDQAFKSAALVESRVGLRLVRYFLLNAVRAFPIGLGREKEV